MTAQPETTPTPGQTFGSDPLSVRDTDHYQKEYVTGFVDKWDELIDWGARAESEGAFSSTRSGSAGLKRCWT